MNTQHGVIRLLDFGPLVTLSLGVLGLFFWRVQLVGKRRAELAEEALLAFAQAADAISFLRSPIRWANELSAFREEQEASTTHKIVGEEFRIVFYRYKQGKENFIRLRRIQLLCRYHFSGNAEAAFGELRAIIEDVLHAAHMGASTQESELKSEDDRAMWREWRNTIWQGLSKPDKIAERVKSAQASLEKELSAHLRRDAAFLPIMLSWQTIRAKFSSFIKSLRKNSSVQS